MKQVDFNGDHSYSNVISVNDDAAKLFAFEVYPNPCTGDNVYVNVSNENDEETIIVVRDIYGREYYSKVLPSNNFAPVKLEFKETLASGVYLIVASNKDNCEKKRLVIQ